MKNVGDHDGKSKTSSAVDSKHYPEMNELEEEEAVPKGQDSDAGAFSHSEIERLAYKLWEEAGYPDGTHEQDWIEAERQLVEIRRDRTDSNTMAAQAGSVQR
jgi:hypothetical protein